MSKGRGGGSVRSGNPLTPTATTKGNQSHASHLSMHSGHIACRNLEIIKHIPASTLLAVTNNNNTTRWRIPFRHKCISVFDFIKVNTFPCDIHHINVSLVLCNLDVIGKKNATLVSAFNPPGRPFLMRNWNKNKPRRESATLAIMQVFV